MDFLKRKLSVRKRSDTTSSTQSSTSTRTSDSEDRRTTPSLSPAEQRIEQLHDERYETSYRRSQDTPSPTTNNNHHSRTRSRSFGMIRTKSRKSSLSQSPAAFVKYGGPGLNAPGNIKNLFPQENNFAFGYSPGEVPPLPQNAHVHGDGQMSDLERYRLQTLSRDPVHGGLAGSERRGGGLEGVVEVEGR
ncbi:hypothetical protein CERZMDRAFT_82482 [Cercospora zeae-maydis SCOH1-5]|uniref:Uncharacterized protein n=1 Tax=Cercospora zeae-maydis SCOH1-5 TaxID=717836 RepID=A0A6A6FQ70_9PEZI|nr:hypothetical protein CERZMDRAFT_82482 [Cercospora zeae-maydis SCOH1-5]